MSRQGRMAEVGARPSRLKNEPGIFPAAYIRSSISTVSGKKSAPGRGDRDPVAVTNTVDRPSWASTAPPARLARRPVANDIVFSVPLKVWDRVVASLISLFSSSYWIPSGTIPERATAARCGRPGSKSMSPVVFWLVVGFGYPISDPETGGRRSAQAAGT